MLALFASLASLALAPVIYSAATKFERLWTITHKALVWVVASLVVLHLLPDSIRIAGLPAVVWAFTGLWAPAIAKNLRVTKTQRVYQTSTIISVLGLSIHGMLDGASLSEPRAGMIYASSFLAFKWAVVLHRLPTATLLWSIFYPKKGPIIASSLLIVLAITTILGFTMGMVLLEGLNDLKYYYHFQALVSGTLLNVAFHPLNSIGQNAKIAPPTETVD